MNPILAGVVLVVVAGAIVAIAGQDVRISVLGLTVVLVGSTLIADPAAGTLGLAARFFGAILAGYLLAIVARDRSSSGEPAAATGGSRIGWPAEVLVAIGALVVGFAAHGLGAPAAGPALASAAGFSIAAIALTPILTGRDIVRVGIGTVLLLDAGLLVRAGLGGTPGDFEQLLTAGMLVVVTGALAVLAAYARTDGNDGFALSSDEVAGPGRRALGRGIGRARRRREPDAHPIEAPRLRTR
ncbi:MAG: hypothetical protein ACXW4L_01575 [Candidatus Limnocylindrales bacterium]